MRDCLLHRRHHEWGHICAAYYVRWTAQHPENNGLTSDQQYQFMYEETVLNEVAPIMYEM